MARSTSQPDEYRALRRRSVRGVHLSEGTHKGGGVIPWHSHDTATMCFVLDGRFAEYSAGHVADCVPSSLKVMPAGERHWNRFHAGDVRGFMAELERATLGHEPRVIAALDRQAQFVSGVEVALARRLYSEFQQSDSAAPLAIEGLLLELLAQLARTDERIAAGGVPDWLKRAGELVHDSATTPLTVTTIALAVGVQPATLARGFRRAFGCTIAELQRRLRLERALVELADRRYSISQVAHRAGFYDQSHFTNLFRQSYGTTPGRYRRELTRV